MFFSYRVQESGRKLCQLSTAVAMGVTESKLFVTEEISFDEMHFICCSPLKKDQFDSPGASKKIVPGRRAKTPSSSQSFDDKLNARRARLQDQNNQDKANAGTDLYTYRQTTSLQIPTDMSIKKEQHDARINKPDNLNRNCRAGGELPWSESEIQNLFRSVKDSSSANRVKPLDFASVQV